MAKTNPIPTIADALERYLEEVTVHKKNAYVSEASLVKMWTLECGDLRLDKMDGPRLAKLRDKWLETYQPSTVVRRLSILSHLYTIAYKEWGIKVENPIRAIRKPRIRNERTRRIIKNIGVPGMPDTEINWLVRTRVHPLVGPLILFAVNTAMRRSEIANLRWEHVELNKRTLRIPDTKNGYERTIPLSPRAISVLERLEPQSKGKVFAISTDLITHVFGSARNVARSLYVSKCRQHKVQVDPKLFVDLHFHDLRHEAISRMAPHFHAHELARISGHRDTRMLMRYYHPDPQDLALKLAKMYQGE